MTLSPRDISYAMIPELRERYKIMSVPCLIINKAQVAFGKKTLGQLLELLAEPEAGQTG